MKHLFIVSLFSFILLHCKSISSFIICFSLIILYKYKFNKINNKHIFLMLLLYLNSIHNYSIYNNQVIETYENYVIASIDHQKVLVYTDDIYFKGEKIEAIGNKKIISSLSNFNITTFEEIMNQKNIKYYLNNEDVKIYKTNNIKRYMYEKITSFNDQYLLKIFYGFTNNHLLVSSGLHYSYLNQCLLKLFPAFITNIILILFSIMFPFKFPILRILLSNSIKCISNLSKKDRCGLLYVLCMLIYPSSIYSLSFIIPYIFNITFLFVSNKNTRKIINKCCLFFLQFYYFYECNILSILFFGIYRNINNLLFIVGIVQLLLPFSLKLNSLYIIIENIFTNYSLFLYGHVSTILLILFILFCLYTMHDHKKIIYCILLLIYLPIQSYINPMYIVDFINVGQGDSILIRAPFNQYNVLIDIPKNKDDEIITYLKSLGIYKIDTLVFTHDDSDHCGGKDEFIMNFKVNEIITEKRSIYHKYLQLININELSYDNENDNSLVFYSNIGGLNYCLMGDASKEVEEDIIDKYKISCDILKVGHHGSKTSTSPLFIQRTNPNVGIISVGSNNYYGHPHEEVLDILNKYKVKTLLTSLNGAISIKSLLNFHFYSTSLKEFGIILSE